MGSVTPPIISNARAPNRRKKSSKKNIGNITATFDTYRIIREDGLVKNATIADLILSFSIDKLDSHILIEADSSTYSKVQSIKLNGKRIKYNYFDCDLAVSESRESLRISGITIGRTLLAKSKSPCQIDIAFSELEDDKFKLVFLNEEESQLTLIDTSKKTAKRASRTKSNPSKPKSKRVIKSTYDLDLDLELELDLDFNSDSDVKRRVLLLSKPDDSYSETKQHPDQPYEFRKLQERIVDDSEIFGSDDAYKPLFTKEDPKKGDSGLKHKVKEIFLNDDNTEIESNSESEEPHSRSRSRPILSKRSRSSYLKKLKLRAIKNSQRNSGGKKKINYESSEHNEDSQEVESGSDEGFEEEAFEKGCRDCKDGCKVKDKCHSKCRPKCHSKCHSKCHHKCHSKCRCHCRPRCRPHCRPHCRNSCGCDECQRQNSTYSDTNIIDKIKSYNRMHLGSGSAVPNSNLNQELDVLNERIREKFVKTRDHSSYNPEAFGKYLNVVYSYLEKRHGRSFGELLFSILMHQD